MSTADLFASNLKYTFIEYLVPSSLRTLCDLSQLYLLFHYFPLIVGAKKTMYIEKGSTVKHSPPLFIS